MLLVLPGVGGGHDEESLWQKRSLCAGAYCNSFHRCCSAERSGWPTTCCSVSKQQIPCTGSVASFLTLRLLTVACLQRQFIAHMVCSKKTMQVAGVFLACISYLLVILVWVFLRIRSCKVSMCLSPTAERDSRRPHHRERWLRLVIILASNPK